MSDLAPGKPAVELRPGLWVKEETGHPTGTFKDRGAAVMMGVAASLGVKRVVVDSSGNAGRAAAYHGARHGLEVSVFVPASTPTPAVAAIEALGGSVVAVGDRAGAASVAQAQVEQTGTWYASHVYQPAFHHGVKTLAFELGAMAPGTVVVPAGNGTLVLGLWLGFRELVALGRLASVPRLVAVQAEECAPLVGLTVRGQTAATGIAIAHPPRLGQVRGAVMASGGRFLVAAEGNLAPAQADLARLGFPGMSLTSSVVWAAIGIGSELPAPGPVVVVLSGRA